MKNIKTLSALMAAVLTLFHFCSKDLCTASDTTTIAARIVWKSGNTIQPIPAGIDSVRITISSESLEADLVQTFSYEDKQGTFSGVPTGISITIRIDGIDSAGTVAYSGTVEVAEVTGPTMEITIEAHQVTPFAPSNLVANELSFDQIRLIWADNSSNETHFIVYRYDTTNSVYDSIAQTITNSHTDTGLTPLTSYQYIVRAYNQAGYSNPSNSASATTLFMDNTGPTITIESHTDPDTVNKRSITLYGKVTDTSGIFQFFVNNLLADVNDDIWIVQNFYLPDTLANQIILKATDNSVFKNVSQYTITVVYKGDYIDTTNHAPVFTVSSSDLEATIKAGVQYEKILTAFDQDANDSMWFEVSAKLTLSADTIRWTPQISDTGTNIFYALVKDRKLAKDSIHWTVTVLDTGSSVPNTPPEFITQVSDLKNSVVQNTQYLDTLKAEDIDDDNLIFSKISGPTGLAIDPVTGIISWIPADTGSFNVIARVADDSAAFDEIAWTIKVFPEQVQPNRPPEFITTTDDMEDAVIIGGEYTDTVVATDPDIGDTLKYYLINGPVSIGTYNGIITWKPLSKCTVNVTVRVKDDSSAYDDLRWEITVIDSPVIKPDITVDPWPLTVNVGQSATFGVVATGTKPFTYQWQKDSVDIPTGTDSSYTIPATVTGDSGCTFRCIVSNSAGGDTSAAALLKVSSDTTVTDIDGNVYHTVMIGNQVWTVENLRTTRLNDGTEIPNITDNADWADLSTPGYCYHSNDSAANAVKYGALYNFYAVYSGKLAPAGWHVPSDEEWTDLEEFLIANGYNWDGTTEGNKIAKSMAAKTDWDSSDVEGHIGNNPSTNNSSGFSALPGGCRGLSSFTPIRQYGYWWSTTESNTNAYYRILHYDKEHSNRYATTQKGGMSVRLVRD